MATGTKKLDGGGRRILEKLWLANAGSRREFAKKLARVKKQGARTNKDEENAADKLLERLANGTRDLTVATSNLVAKTLGIPRLDFESQIFNIEPDGVSSQLNTKEYFDLFFDYINSDRTKKKVRVFARWLHFEIREKPMPEGFFQRFKEPFKSGLIDVEYVFFLTRPSSLKKSFVKRLLGEYCQFASEIRIHYIATTSFEHAETSHTIAIWEGYHSYFTHEWDFKGQIYNLIEWSSESDKARLVRTYEKIKAASAPYFCRETK
jgi:hypothetical protein